MSATVLYGPGDIRFEDRETPRIEKPTDAIVRIAATCVCGSTLASTISLEKKSEGSRGRRALTLVVVAAPSRRRR
jgi:threonine dehydrogenase-like Zn-dependent dehydrogenase